MLCIVACDIVAVNGCILSVQAGLLNSQLAPLRYRQQEVDEASRQRQECLAVDSQANLSKAASAATAGHIHWAMLT